jgi:hypothetical protein
VQPGFVAPLLDEKTLSLGHPETRALLDGMLFGLQPSHTLSDRPKVDHFRHVNTGR